MTASLPDPPPPATVPGTTGLAPNLAATLATLFSLIGGVVFLALEKRDRYVRFWAMQAAFWGGLALAFSVALAVVGFVFVHIPVVNLIMAIILGVIHFAFGLCWLAVYLICIFKAFSGQEWEIPWIGAMARQQLAQMDVSAGPAAAAPFGATPPVASAAPPPPPPPPPPPEPPSVTVL